MDAKKDVALTTHLNLIEAGRLLEWFEGRLHPYDVVPAMVDLHFAVEAADYSRIGGVIAGLLDRRGEDAL